MKKIAVTNSQINHYGSTQQGPVASSLNHNPTFVRINNVDVVLSTDKIDTPSHIYDYDEEGHPLYHSHPNQDIDVLYNDYIRVNGSYVVVEGDGNSTNQTYIDNAGQDFVFIS